MFFNKFTCYILINNLHPDEILTITNTLDECKEFYHKYLCLKHIEIFKPWCKNRNIDFKDINSWYKYYNEKISSAEAGTYQITKLNFNKKELAALLRAFSKAPLIGCSFETDFDNTIRRD